LSAKTNWIGCVNYIKSRKQNVLHSHNFFAKLGDSFQILYFDIQQLAFLVELSFRKDLFNNASVFLKRLNKSK